MKVTVDERKFAFIMCTNNRQYCLEALHYIKSLAVPDGYTVETCIIEDAKSMTEGYQRAMLSSGAKYKIYLHQDVMIVEKNFLQHLLDVFADRKIGMIGMIGSPRMPENSVMWYGERIGCIYSSSAYHMQMYTAGARAAVSAGRSGRWAFDGDTVRYSVERRFVPEMGFL